jgi:hypothetical protein
VKRVFFVKIGEEPAMEVIASSTVEIETVAAWLREAADHFSGDTKTCGDCDQATYKHEGFVCQDCGEVGAPRLRLVKGVTKTFQARVGDPQRQRTIREISRIAFSDIRNLLLEDGTVLPFQDLPPDVAAAVRSFKTTEVLTRNVGDQEVLIRRTVEVDLADKVKSLEILGQYLGLFPPEVTLLVTPEGPEQRGLTPDANHGGEGQAERSAF